MNNALYKVEKCSFCHIENCLDCFFYGDGQLCNKCEDDFRNDLENGKCVPSFVYSYDCSSFKLKNCIKCLNSGECVKCKDNYEIDDHGKCKKKKKKGILSAFISIGIFVLLILLYFCYKIYEKRSSNSIRINLNNRNSINNRNNIHNNNANNNINNIYNNSNANLYERNQKEQIILNNEIILNEKDLSDEFNRRKIKSENKLCQICKTGKGKYVGDCGCIVCEKHSNFKEVINNEGKFKICFNCGKTIKDLKLIKANCHICLEDVPSVCHFNCCCALEVCEKCYIKCKKMGKKCPGCRGNI